jgi:glucose/arabinose dehydrogenase
VPPGDLVFRGTDLFMSSLWSAALLRIRFEDRTQPDRVTGIERWFNTRIWRDGEAGEAVYGRLRALAVGPDGALYLGTSNRDGRLEPGPDDDRVLRISFPES